MFSFFKKKKEIVEKKDQTVSKVEVFDSIEPLLQYFQEETGITFEKQIDIFTNKVILFCRQRNIYSFSELIKMLDSDVVIKQEFIDYLTTNETYFYREFKQIWQCVEFAKNENKDIKILCAPSATGEEPYSIAIAMLEAGICANKIHITGIDINQEALQKAKQAIYKERNIRNLSSKILEKYFIKENDKYILKNSIKSLVSFHLANIFDESFKNLGKYDFVFSRNMLIYFDKKTKHKAKVILESMRKSKEHEVFFGHADLY